MSATDVTRAGSLGHHYHDSSVGLLIGFMWLGSELNTFNGMMGLKCQSGVKMDILSCESNLFLVKPD